MCLISRAHERSTSPVRDLSTPDIPRTSRTGDSQQPGPTLQEHAPRHELRSGGLGPGEVLLFMPPALDTAPPAPGVVEHGKGLPAPPPPWRGSGYTPAHPCTPLHTPAHPCAPLQALGARHFGDPSFVTMELLMGRAQGTSDHEVRIRAMRGGDPRMLQAPAAGGQGSWGREASLGPRPSP